jgi:predicted MFS family arabinose efflux permease
VEHVRPGSSLCGYPGLFALLAADLCPDRIDLYDRRTDILTGYAIVVAICAIIAVAPDFDRFFTGRYLLAGPAVSSFQSID